jgi:putative serine/threonine protein kinase
MSFPRKMQSAKEIQSASANSSTEDSLTINVSDLKVDLHGSVLCYPGKDLSSFSNRVKQLKELGIGKVTFEGSSKIGSYGVVGKGCVSVVLKARLEDHDDLVVALKSRRVDANRESMRKDYDLQRIANSVGVGPTAIRASNDFFAMEYVDSTKIGKWLEKLKTKGSKKLVKSILRDSLAQCFKLDERGLDHGELSNPTKHILIRKDKEGEAIPKTVIIDYESSSIARRASNFTSVAQFFFLGSYQSTKIKRIIGFDGTKSNLISLLKDYKTAPSVESFEGFLEYVGC